MTSLDILCSNPLNLNFKITKIEDKKTVPNSFTQKHGCTKDCSENSRKIIIKLSKVETFFGSMIKRINNTYNLRNFQKFEVNKHELSVLCNNGDSCRNA